MKFFTVVHNDGDVQVHIDDDGHAILKVGGIEDDEVIVRAINQTHAAGAQSGTLFTGNVVNDQVARMHTRRAERGTTWLDGKVTRLADGPQGDPQFRIDWETFPEITK